MYEMRVCQSVGDLTKSDDRMKNESINHHSHPDQVPPQNSSLVDAWTTIVTEKMIDIIIQIIPPSAIHNCTPGNNAHTFTCRPR